VWESALARPLNKFGYGTKDLTELAAAYAFGLARNRAFVDGNKRIAFLAMVTFLGLNDIDFIVSEVGAVVMMQSLASGEVDEEGLARWIRDNLPGA
jgi:death-on-curing protein